MDGQEDRHHLAGHAQNADFAPETGAALAAAGWCWQGLGNDDPQVLQNPYLTLCFREAFGRAPLGVVHAQGHITGALHTCKPDLMPSTQANTTTLTHWQYQLRMQHRSRTGCLCFCILAGLVLSPCFCWFVALYVPVSKTPTPMWHRDSSGHGLKWRQQASCCSISTSAAASSCTRPASSARSTGALRLWLAPSQPHGQLLRDTQRHTMVLCLVDPLDWPSRSDP